MSSWTRDHKVQEIKTIEISIQTQFSAHHSKRGCVSRLGTSSPLCPIKKNGRGIAARPAIHAWRQNAVRYVTTLVIGGTNQQNSVTHNTGNCAKWRHRMLRPKLFIVVDVIVSAINSSPCNVHIECRSHQPYSLKFALSMSFSHRKDMSYRPHIAI